MSGIWRIGRKLGRTLYVDDHVVGMVDTPELAARIVAAMNADHVRRHGCDPGCYCAVCDGKATRG